MSNEPRRTDAGVIVGVALIALGGWWLLSGVLGSAFEPVRRVLDTIRAFGWPLAVIAAGILIIIASQQGNWGERLRGKRLYRSRKDRMVSGVLGGLGEFLDIDPTWLRVVYALMTVAISFWPGVVLYVVAAIIVPEQPTRPLEPPIWPTRTPTPPSPDLPISIESGETMPVPPAAPVPHPPQDQGCAPGEEVPPCEQSELPPDRMPS